MRTKVRAFPRENRPPKRLPNCALLPGMLDSISTATRSNMGVAGGRIFSLGITGTSRKRTVTPSRCKIASGELLKCSGAVRETRCKNERGYFRLWEGYWLGLL